MAQLVLLLALLSVRGSIRLPSDPQRKSSGDISDDTSSRRTITETDAIEELKSEIKRFTDSPPTLAISKPLRRHVLIDDEPTGFDDSREDDTIAEDQQEQPNFYEVTPFTYKDPVSHKVFKAADISYRVHETRNDPKKLKWAVLVHGIADWSYRWDGFVKYLNREGYTVLRYDHINRGNSEDMPLVSDRDDVPSVTLNSHFYRSELEHVMNAAGVGPRFTLIGHSMGGAVSIAYAAGIGEKLRDDTKVIRTIDQLILLAPAGFFGKFDGFKVWVLRLFSKKTLKSKFEEHFFATTEAELAKDFFHPEGQVFNDFRAPQLAMVKEHPQFFDAFVATIHDFRQLTRVTKEAKILAKTDIPILALFGEHDITVNTENAVERMASVMGMVNGKVRPNFSIKIVPNTRHCFFVEDARTTFEYVDEFLHRSKSSKS